LNRETLRKIGLKKYLKNNIIDTSAEVDKICIDEVDLSSYHVFTEEDRK